MINENARESVVGAGLIIGPKGTLFNVAQMMLLLLLLRVSILCACVTGSGCGVRAEFNKNSNGFLMIISWLAKSNSKRLS